MVYLLLQKKIMNQIIFTHVEIINIINWDQEIILVKISLGKLIFSFKKMNTFDS